MYKPISPQLKFLENPRKTHETTAKMLLSQNKLGRFKPSGNMVVT